MGTLVATAVAVGGVASPGTAWAEPGNPAPSAPQPVGPQAVGPPGTPGLPEDGTAMVVEGEPTKEQVTAVRDAVARAEADLGLVGTALGIAGRQQGEAARRAGRAADGLEVARRKADAATAVADAAQADADVAHAAADVQRDAYVDAVTSGYAAVPSLGALGALGSADGLSDLIEDTATLSNAEQALDARWSDFLAAATAADAAQQAAQDRQDDADRAARKAERASEAADALAAFSREQTFSVTVQRASVTGQLQVQRQALEALVERRETAEEWREETRRLRAVVKAGKSAKAKSAEPATGGKDEDQAGKDPVAEAAAELAARDEEPDWGEPVTVPAYEGITGGLPVATPSGPAPKPGRGAAPALAFARAQIGEPYVWGAAGPSAWDCSGLVMGAWANGGKLLPHYSVAQYAASTPISPADLQPGDLVFWGHTPDPGSIYHVALYSGDGMIIQAPRSGVPVQETSMTAWVAPQFFARP